MSRFQIILFSFLTAVALTFLLLGPSADLRVSTGLSSVLLLPIRIVNRYVEYLGVSRDRIEKLERSMHRLTLENAELRERVATDSLSFAPTGYRLVRAKVIGRDPSNFNGFLYIDRSRRDSLSPGQAVVTNQGLVGRVKYAGDFTSVVETIENLGICVSARDARTGVQGIVKQDDGLILDYIKIADPIETGDTIVTSGMSESFPTGISIATVKDVRETGDLLFKKVALLPCVPVNRLYYLYIIRPGPSPAPAADTGPAPVYNPIWDLKPVIPGSNR